MRRQISISVLLAALIASLTSGPANAVDTRTCAQGGTCAVGDVGPGGGVVFYARVSGAFTDSYSNQFDDGDDGLRTYTAQVDMTSSEVVALTFDYLEFAPSSGFTSLKQASADGLTVTFSKFGTGQTNTSAFLADFPGDNGTNNASHWANNYAANGYQDWFLPSTDELALLLIRHLKGQLGSSSPLSGNYYQAWTSENGIIFLSSPSQIVMSFGKNSTDQNFIIPIRAFSSTPAPAPTTTPTPAPTTSAVPVVATPAKVFATSKIKFDRSSSVLTKASKAKLKKLAKSVGADAEIKVQAAVGPLNNASKAQMRALAKLRAKAIAKYLKSQISMNQTYKIKIIDEGFKPVTTVKAN
jgi:hypothetical protein